MQREILFRGISTSSNKWVYGDFSFDPNSGYFIGEVYHFNGSPTEPPYNEYKFVEVRHETVGQFIGLTDKNGKKIFEGDIVHSEKWGPEKMLIGFDTGAFYLSDIKTKEGIADIKYVEYMTVIGNIHQNPELLNQ